MIVTYVRVLTIKQDTLRQEIQLDKLGVKFDKHYTDKMSGRTADRPQLNKMLLEIKKGRHFVLWKYFQVKKKFKRPYRDNKAASW